MTNIMDWRQPFPYTPLHGWLLLSLLEVTSMDQLAISPEPFIEKCRSLARAKNV